MRNTVILDESIEVQRPLHEVFAYVSEFSRIEEWDPAVARGIKQTPGAPGVDSEYQIDMKAGFSLQYRVIEFEENARMLMTVDSRFFTALEEIRFKASRNGTRVRYIAKFDFPAPLAAFNRAFPAAMERVGKRAMAGLKEALEDKFDAPQASKVLAAADRLILPGIWRFTKLGYRESRRRWDAVSAYQGDRHALITGATSGLGKAAAHQLAALGARLTLVARSKEKAEELVAELQEQTGNERIAYEIADLSVMSEVHALCDRLLAADEPVDMLINNAGALFNPRQQTPEGFEKSFALLLLSPCILTERLHPLLQKAASPRVVNVLSGGMYSQKIRVNDLQSQRGEYSGSVAYARAKRGLMIMTEEWAKRWRKDGHCRQCHASRVGRILPALKRHFRVSTASQKGCCARRKKGPTQSCGLRRRPRQPRSQASSGWIASSIRATYRRALGRLALSGANCSRLWMNCASRRGQRSRVGAARPVPNRKGVRPDRI